MQHDVPRESLTEAAETPVEVSVQSAQPVVEEVDRRQAEQEEARQIAQAEEQRQAEEARRLAEEQAARNEQAQRQRESQKKTTGTVRPAATPEDAEAPSRTPGGRRRETARKTPRTLGPPWRAAAPALRKDDDQPARSMTVRGRTGPLARLGPPRPRAGTPAVAR